MLPSGPSLEPRHTTELTQEQLLEQMMVLQNFCSSEQLAQASSIDAVIAAVEGDLNELIQETDSFLSRKLMRNTTKRKEFVRMNVLRAVNQYGKEVRKITKATDRNLVGIISAIKEQA